MKKQKRYQRLTAVAVAVTTLCVSHAAFSLTAAPNKDATAITKQENAEVYKQLREFVLPYIDIRNRHKGYAVSIVKAGMRAIGRPAGPVRSPLTDLDQSEREALTKLIAGRA